MLTVYFDCFVFVCSSADRCGEGGGGSGFREGT